jgi:3-phenylpropionate/trans-cinnamate dioxygenase ferredoxin subunit
MDQSLTYHPVFKEHELQEGELRGVFVGDLEIVVVKTGGTFYALQNRCGHMSTFLSEGSIKGVALQCAFHGAEFDIKTGKVLQTPQIQPEYAANFGPRSGQKISLVPTKPIQTFAVRVRDQMVEVGIPRRDPV